MSLVSAFMSAVRTWPWSSGWVQAEHVTEFVGGDPSEVPYGVGVRPSQPPIVYHRSLLLKMTSASTMAPVEERVQ